MLTCALARTAVHFQDIVERYQPYETLLEITTAEGLNDTSLAAAFPLHTAPSSVNATRLHEISEDAEDGGDTVPKQPPKQSNNGSIFGTRQYKMERRVEQVMRPAPPASNRGDGTGNSSIAAQILAREDSGKRSLASVSSPLSESSTDNMAASTAPSDISPSREETSKPDLATHTPKSPLSSSVVAESPSSEQAKAVDQAAQKPSSSSPLPQNSDLPKSPVEASSPAKQETAADERPKKVEEEEFDFSYLEPKAKVRLAPRPVAQSAQVKRATTSGTSALPAHYKPVTRKQDNHQSLSSLSSSSQFLSTLPVPPIPDAPEYNPRPISRGSVRSLTSQKNSAMTPEKLRLMKAVELRKKQLRKSNSNLPSSVPGISSEDTAAVPAVPQVPEQIVEQPKNEAKAEELHRRVVAEEASAKKADSGIEMDYEKNQEAAREQKHVAPRNEPVTEEDKLAAEALRNDELKAEAEGYGAIPAEEPEESQPRLVRRSLPATDNTNDNLSPLSNYSDAKTDQPLSIAAAQAATQALNESQDAVEAAPSKHTDEAAVPSIVMSPGSPPSTAHGETTPTIATAQAGAGADQKDENDSDSDSQSTLEVQQSPRRQNSDLAKRRRGFVEPLALESAKDILAADDELMDELQSAQVEEARPAAVARSPAAAYFPRRPSNLSLASASSQPSEHSTLSRKHTGSDALEASPKPEKATASEDNSVVKRPVSPVDSTSENQAGIKRNVSSGIAKRFQALSETSTPQESPADRKLRSPHRSRPTSFRNRWGMGDRTSSTSTTASVDAAPTWSVSQDSTGNRDSINVRARIVRPTSGLVSHIEKPEAEESALPQQPQIEISHGPKGVLPALQTSAPEVRSPTRSKYPSFSPQTAVPEDFPAPPVATRPPFSPTVEDTSSKSEGRTSRWFKRMSSLGGSKRKSTAAQSIASSTTAVQSPVLSDHTASAASAASAASVKSVRTPSTITEQDRADMPPAAALGDLNVQFPDTLVSHLHNRITVGFTANITPQLWKRRWITLDDAGSLLLVVSQVKEHQRGAAQKKYRLSEFKLPIIPDLDRQEMPYSVCLELVEGGTLQLACEDAMGQRQVLSMLRTYWKSWVGS